MRTFLIPLLSLIFLYCVGSRGNADKSPQTADTAVVDTVYVEVPAGNEDYVRMLEADVAYWKGIVDSTRGTIPYDEYMNARRIEKIRYYLRICEKRAANKKFFYGWIKRTMEEN